jgi:hypothetical protein
VETSNGPGQVVVVKVVNCAVEYVLLPPEQFALTLQSYKVADVNPLKATEVEVVPLAALIHVAEEFGL